MVDDRPPLRCNPGGTLSPHEVVGRDTFADTVWEALGRQSIQLAAERRMGKTSLLRKLQAEERSGFALMVRNVQGLATVGDFVDQFVEDVRESFPGNLSGPSLRQRTGVRKVEARSFAVELDDRRETPWADRLDQAFVALTKLDVVTVLVWDELPHMVAHIAEREGHDTARELLDVLRAARESYGSVRMIFVGSLGLHHVLKELRPKGRGWVPTHDMRLLDLPALSDPDARALAEELLANEHVACVDPVAVAAAITQQTGAVPYYVHQVVAALIDRGRSAGVAPADVSVVTAVIDDRISDPQDPWQLMHYVDRLGSYYGEEADTVKGLLDVVAVGPPAETFEDLQQRLAVRRPPPTVERLRELVDLLARDHYLSFSSGITFRLDLLRRAWCRRRRLA